LPAGQCLALEDSRNGLLAAKAAGLRCIVSPSLYTTGEDFHEADHVVDDFTWDDIAAMLA
jgi:beta-phosphoglucomutase-like phosphatase (HAD superfamily)